MNPEAHPPATLPATVPFAPLWLLVVITFSGTLAMHIFVPAMPGAAAGLGASTGAMQLTLSLYILGLGQLVYGPVSDRYGRRPTLMVGLGIYTVAGLVAAFAPHVETLIVARLFQALGGCAGLVLGRAIVRDASTPAEAAKRLALMNLMITVGPGLAPLVGGALSSSFGWRSVLFALCALGVTNLMLTWRLLPETSQSAANFDFSTLRHHYAQLVRSPIFLGYSVGGGCTTTPTLAFLACAPFIFTHQLHRPAHEVGIYLALLIVGVSVGNALSSRLPGRVSINRLIILANATSVVAALVFLGLVLTGHLTVISLMATMFVFMVGVGVASPAALTQAIGMNRHVIGSASGLYGFIQMMIGALCAALVGLGRDPALAAAIVLAVSGMLGQIAFWIAMRARPGPGSG